MRNSHGWGDEMDVSIQKYLAFVETVDAGSFTRAAERLHYSQSGVSRMIRDLETEWRLTLLERGKGGVKLTSDGMKLLPLARSVCREQEKLQRQVEELSGLQAGLIRVGAPGCIASERLPAWIGEFRQTCPGIDYELLVGDRGEIEGWLLTGRVDLGIVDLPADPALDTEFLEQDPLLAVLPEGHPAAEEDVFPISDLVDLPFLLPEKEERGEVSALLESCGISPHVRLTSGDEQVILRMVEQGLGISILPSLALRGSTCRVTARRLDVPAYRNMGVALRSKKTASLAVKRFMETILH